MKKSTMGYISAFLVGTLISGGSVFAATNYVKTLEKNSEITMNGQVINEAPALVYGGTTYVQLYSIQQALKSIQMNNTWNGYDFDITYSRNGNSANTSNTSNTSATNTNTNNSNTNVINYSSVNYLNYQIIKDGGTDTLAQVNSILGFPGIEGTSPTTGDTLYYWQNPENYDMIAVIFNSQGNATDIEEVGLDPFTYSNYTQIDSTYSLMDVENLLGTPSDSAEDDQGSNNVLTTYDWQSSDGSMLITVTFDNGMEFSKSEVGLD